MSTVAYRFDNEAAFIAAIGGATLTAEMQGDGVAVSVIGDHYIGEDESPVYDGYLVNTTAEIESFAMALLDPQPSQLMRIFG